MKIGIDVDGVLADFNTACIRRYVQVTGHDLFPREVVADPSNNIPTWYYPTHFGYLDEENKAVWATIAADSAFWLSLQSLPGAEKLLADADHLVHDFYFPTARVGGNAKYQTEHWLVQHGYRSWPSVMISADKAGIAKALKLDVYIDDNLDNANAVCETGTRTFLIDRGWNRSGAIDERIVRVTSLREFVELATH